MQKPLILAAILLVAPLTGCLDSLTDEDLESVTLGCTYKQAVNYDPNAQADDGSCLYDADGDGIVDNLELYGCTYDKAENFNPDATEEDGSCEFAEPVSGCTDKTASNYNSYAEKDDGSCEYVIFGCMDENADNYDPEAQLDNNTCVYYGCIYEDANNFDENATVDDKSCDFSPILGCTDPEANNFNQEATEDDGSCIYCNPYDPFTFDELDEYLEDLGNYETMNYWSDDFERFGVVRTMDMSEISGEMVEDSEDSQESTLVNIGIYKDDTNQVLAAMFGFEMGAGEARIKSSEISVRQGPQCTSGDCTLTNEIQTMSIEGTNDGNSFSMSSENYSYGRDMVPYYGDPVRELIGGENMFYDDGEPLRIEIRNEDGRIYFDSNNETIKPGDEVVWYNGDSVSHTVTARDSSFDSGDIDPYSEWSYTFYSEGTFEYYSDKEQDQEPFGDLSGVITVQEDCGEECLVEFNSFACGIDDDNDGVDDRIIYEISGISNEDPDLLTNLSFVLWKYLNEDKIYPKFIRISDADSNTTIISMETYFGDEVKIEIFDENGDEIYKSPAKFRWDSESDDDNENSQNVYKGNLTGNNYMQEISNHEIEIRILEAYDEDCDEDAESEGECEGKNSAKVIGSMSLADSSHEFIDSETGCRWYIEWHDNDQDGFSSVDDGYDIRTDKMGVTGQSCPRQNETNDEELYVIEFYDTWAESYVGESNNALMPGFSIYFALSAILSIAAFKRRREIKLK